MELAALLMVLGRQQHTIRLQAARRTDRQQKVSL
jgi:hypothetical protein